LSADNSVVRHEAMMTIRGHWAGPQRGAALILLAAIVATMPAPGVTAPALPARPGSAVADRCDGVDHLYRIIGKVRFLVFWASADDVGGARITWHGGERDSIVSLLIGSEPQRAPRQVNEWGYIREEVTDDLTTVFGIRTVTEGDSPEDAEARRTPAGGLAAFGVLCSTVSPFEARSMTTTLHVSGEATYRDVDRVLDVSERGARWTQQHTRRPSGAAPGFLTALDEMMRSSAVAAREIDTIPAVPRRAFVYNDSVYDLSVRRVERVATLQLRSGLFQNLLRTELSVRDRATGATTEFRVTYGTEGELAGVPVYAQYQPNWWFKVELELDRSVDVPADPAADTSIRQRIDSLCGVPPE